MPGFLLDVWPETWRTIWLPLYEIKGVASDMFCELYRELLIALREPTDETVMAYLRADPAGLIRTFEAAAGVAGVAIDEIDDATRARAFAAAESAAESGSDSPFGALADALQVLGVNAITASRAVATAASDLIETKDYRTGAIERVRNDVLNSPDLSLEALRTTRSEDFKGEAAAVRFLERCFAVAEDYGGDDLSNPYFGYVDAFLIRYNLRYDLRRPCQLCPNLPGLFGGLLEELVPLGTADRNVADRHRDFREALQDLRLGITEGRISNCVAKQVMLLEAIAATSQGVTRSELSAMCGQVGQWPHPAARASLLSLYGFASDFPGIRHGSPSAGMLRDVDIRDLIALSVALAGFIPYLSDQFRGDSAYLAE